MVAQHNSIETAVVQRWGLVWHTDASQAVIASRLEVILLLLSCEYSFSCVWAYCIKLASQYLQSIIWVAIQKVLSDLTAAPDVKLLERHTVVCQHSKSFQRHVSTPRNVQLLQSIPVQAKWQVKSVHSPVYTVRCAVINTVQATTLAQMTQLPGCFNCNKTGCS